MKDLEEEFNRLVQEMYLIINSRYGNYEISALEASNLTSKVEAKTGVAPDPQYAEQRTWDPNNDSRYGSRCPDGHADPDCGWSPSMGYHC